MPSLTRHPYTNPTACAIEFMKTVEADNRKCRLTYWLNRRLYSALKLSPRANLPAPRHQIMVTVNEMDRMDCLYRHKRRFYFSTVPFLL